jgi:FlaA1/EpsC-like NDP-sugar epimerase
MYTPQDGFCWGDLLGRPCRETGLSQLSAANADKTILLTGAGGSIGSALAKAILASGPKLLILLEHSEHNLHQLRTELADIPNRASLLPLLGDVCDVSLLTEIFERHRPDTVFHTAAFKHVPLMETNPIAAVWNNAIGTYRLAKVAAEHRAPRLIMISTDKVANPRSMMGASKRIAELALLGFGGQETRMRAVRLGNVLGTQGSVVPLFLEQIARGGPVTVTHPEVCRYFVTLLEAVEVILKIALRESGDGIFVPEMGLPVKILDLANHLIRHVRSAQSKTIPITFTGLRPGDKMKEALVSDGESLEPGTQAGIHRIRGREVPKDEWGADVLELTEAVHRRDLAALLEIVHHLVPEYQPSSTLLELLSSPLAGAPKV